MTRIRGARAIVRCLEREGIDLVLGIPGLYNMPIFDALYRHPTIRVVTTRHEQGAAFMADGYARATGKPAALLLLPGPGVTNAMTALGEAFYDSSPVLVLATQVDREFIGRQAGLLHEMTHQFEMLAPLMKYSESIPAAAEIPGAFRRAMAALRQGRPRPVQLEIPRDVQVEVVDWQEDLEPARSYESGDQRPADELIVAAADALVLSERPLVLAGGGVVSSGAAAELVSLAERLGAPVLTTGMGVGSIPSDHPLACGVPWVAAGDVRSLVKACDAFFAVGTRFNQAMTHNWELQLPQNSIRIDIDADEIGRNLPMRLKLVGDARITLSALIESLSERGLDRQGKIHARLASAQAAFRQSLLEKAGSTLPWMEALRDALPRETIISCDMSLFWADMLATFPVYEPRSLLFPWGFGTLGFALPEALGAKLGSPNRPAIAISGDGAFLFTGAELATAVQYGINIPILVSNNNAYGMIKVQQRDQFDEQFIAVDLHNPDFVRLARAFGAYGERVTTAEAMHAAILRALAADRPTVIEIPWAWTWGNENSGSKL